MEKRYQVFVSSTYEDLQDERREVMQTLLPLNCIPTGMDLFPAADEDSWTLIKRFISECDYYIVIVGGRYGSVGPNGKSYTEMEYDFAVEAGVPVLPFLHGDPGQIPTSKAESTDDGRAALSGFRKKIEAARHAKYWTSPTDLAGKVAVSMTSLMQIRPRVGWVRADKVPSESTAEEILFLRRKIEELEAQIADNQINPPPGTEGLAQGDERISVHFRYEAEVGRNYFDGEDVFTWNQILSVVGPILIPQASEQELKNKLVEVISNRYRDKNRRNIYSLHLRDEDFQKIKLQLRALALIRESDTRSEKGKAEKAWTLTPYGDRLMTQVAALRSSAKA